MMTVDDEAAPGRAAFDRGTDRPGLTAAKLGHRVEEMSHRGDTKVEHGLGFARSRVRVPTRHDDSSNAKFSFRAIRRSAPGYTGQSRVTTEPAKPRASRVRRTE